MRRYGEHTFTISVAAHATNVIVQIFTVAYYDPYFSSPEEHGKHNTT